MPTKTMAFKQVNPKHFFINIKGYERDPIWGAFVADIANSSKSQVLTPSSTVNKDLLAIGKKYTKIQRAKGFGEEKTSGDIDYDIPLKSYGKYASYYRKLKSKFKEFQLKNNLKKRFIEPNRFFKTFQIQDKVDKKKVVLTQVGYEYDKQLNTIKKDSGLLFIHPPAETHKILNKKAEKYLKELKKYKNIKKTEADIDKIYENIGSIHWCIAQGMPFLRGSAAIADIYTKSLFEALNIQVNPWKKNIAPDFEAFITPLPDYAKKYKTFFKPNMTLKQGLPQYLYQIVKKPFD